MTANTESDLQTASELLRTWTQSTSNPEPNRLDVFISRTDLLAAVTALKDARWGFLSAITGLDHLKLETPSPQKAGKSADETAQDPQPEEPLLEVLYHFCQGAAVVTLRIKLTRSVPSLPSICALLPSASMYERELSELFGIDVLGTPDSSHLLLPDDWPNGVYPLRKDFTGLEKASKPEGKDAN